MTSAPHTLGNAVPADISATPSSARRVAAHYPDLEGRIVIVTGASHGIGAATARLFAANGSSVVVNGRDAEAIESVVQSIRSAGGRAMGFAADATNFAAIERMRQATESQIGPADILATFAGGGISRPGPLPILTEKAWRSTIDENLTATFLTLKSFLPGLIERRRGSIITMASSAARIPSPAPIAYSAAKAGIIMLSRQLAVEVAPHGIRVNCLAPSAIMTERNQRVMSAEAQRHAAAAHPLGRLGTPEDVAEVAVFLASEAASWLTGLTIDVAGGRVVQ